MKIITEWEAKPCRSHIGEIYPKGLWNSHSPISPLYSPLCNTCLASPSWWEQVPGLGEQFKPQFWQHMAEPAPWGTFKHFYSLLPKLLAALTMAQEPNRCDFLWVSWSGCTSANPTLHSRRSGIPCSSWSDTITLSSLWGKLCPCSPAHPSEPPALQG